MNYTATINTRDHVIKVTHPNGEVRAWQDRSHTPTQALRRAGYTLASSIQFRDQTHMVTQVQPDLHRFGTLRAWNMLVA